LAPGNGTAKAGRTRTVPENDPAKLEHRMVERVKKAVLEEVMAEIRPLLQELAELNRARKEGKPSTGASAALVLQEQALERMEELEKKLTERVRLSEARFLQATKKRD
jgi:hypothetical protein